MAGPVRGVWQVVRLPEVPALNARRADILDALNHAKLAPDKLQMIDSTVNRAHHHAAGAKGGLRKRLLAAQEVGSRPRSISA